jgi:hypothetical protein
MWLWSPSLRRLSVLWQQDIAPSGRLALGALGGAGLVAAATVARTGTSAGRLAGAAGLAVVCLVIAVRLLVVKRRQADPFRLVRSTLAQSEPAVGLAALRALRLVRETAIEPKLGSAELARLHLARLLERASPTALGAWAARMAWRRSVLGLALAVGCLGVVLFDPFRIVEGLAVLCARRGLAPVALDWLGEPRVSAEPPAYLHRRLRALDPTMPVTVHVGTVLSVAGEPRHAGRKLVLTDGTTEVPFVDDGKGATVARWTVQGDTELRVAARFGAVRIQAPDRVEVLGIADLPPIVRLEGAPRTAQLLEEPRIPIHYEAADDHGLRQVDLVLRAGGREQRRSLSQPKGSVRFDRGGIDLRMDDDFLKQSHLPVEVTVEAQDDDAVTGPKWGRSASLVVVPPRVGEQEALRYAAVCEARDALVDLLAARLVRLEPGDDADATKAPGAGPLARFGPATLGAEQQAQSDALRKVEAALSRQHGELGFGGSLAVLVAAQTERLGDALGAFERAPAAASASKLVAATESAVLVVDAALEILDERGAQQSARELAEVANEAASSIAQGRASEERARADRRLDASLSVLEGGATELVRLGALGKDLGGITHSGLRRIRRAWAAGDRFHARLAAEDLAARLRVPERSFKSAGGAGGGVAGGVETGGARGLEQGDKSEAAEEAAGMEQALDARDLRPVLLAQLVERAMEQALDQLRQEHGAEISSVERAMEQAASAEDRAELASELRQRAEAVRQAANELPRTGGDSSSGRAAAAAARAQAEGMAAALERGDMQGAVSRGKDAMDALGTAEQLGREASAGSQDGAAAGQAGATRGKLAPELAWAEKKLEELERRASERAAEQLERAAGRERSLAERARRIRESSADGQAPLPKSLLDRLGQAAQAMDRASRELGQRRGRSGLERQREAQQLLEMSEPEPETAPDSRGAPGNDGTRMAQDVAVPGAHRDERADEFRKRVTDGLRGTVPPHLRDALRRYTEGLLR